MTDRKRKRTLPETLSQIQRLKIYLLGHDYPLALGEIAEDMELTQNETSRLLEQIGATKYRHGLYIYMPTEADVELASAIYERVSQLARGAEAKMQQVYPE
jgi:hypothetical protein